MITVNDKQFSWGGYTNQSHLLHHIGSLQNTSRHKIRSQVGTIVAAFQNSFTGRHNRCSISLPAHYPPPPTPPPPTTTHRPSSPHTLRPIPGPPQVTHRWCWPPNLPLPCQSPMKPANLESFPVKTEMLCLRRSSNTSICSVRPWCAMSPVGRSTSVPELFYSSPSSSIPSLNPQPSYPQFHGPDC